MDVAQEPGELNRKGNPEVGFDGPGMVSDKHELRDQAGALRQLRAGGCRGCQEALPEFIRLGASGA